MVHSFIDKINILIRYLKIPAIYLAGILFLSSKIFSSEFVDNLFYNKDYLSAYRESLRIIKENSADHKIKYIYAFSILHIKSIQDKSEAIAILDQLTDLKEINNNIACLSSYKLGRYFIYQENYEKAFKYLSFVFYHCKNKELFLHAACSIYLLNKKYYNYSEIYPVLFDQINSTTILWNKNIFNDCKINVKQNNSSENFIVYFYRRNIRPAIGDRCIIEPSCSEYFRQAYIKHGIFSFPIIADRFFREPGIAENEEKLFISDTGLIKYNDPLKDHDFWIKK